MGGLLSRRIEEGGGYKKIHHPPSDHSKQITLYHGQDNRCGAVREYPAWNQSETDKTRLRLKQRGHTSLSCENCSGDLFVRERKWHIRQHFYKNTANTIMLRFCWTLYLIWHFCDVYFHNCCCASIFWGHANYIITFYSDICLSGTFDLYIIRILSFFVTS